MLVNNFLNIFQRKNIGTYIMNITHDDNFIELQKSLFTNYKARFIDIFYDYNNFISINND